MTQYTLAGCALLVTVLLVLIGYKNKQLHQLQIDIQIAQFEKEKAAIDAGIKKDDLKSLSLKDAYEKAINRYNNLHANDK